MGEDDLAEELLVAVPYPDDAASITSDQQINEFVKIAPRKRPIMLSLLLAVNVEQTFIITIELEQVRLT